MPDQDPTARLAKLQAQREQLDSEIAALEAASQRQALEEIAEIAHKAGLSGRQITAHLAEHRTAKTNKGVIKPKYRNPSPPHQTWAGRGKQPVWVRTHLEAGNSLEDLLITQAS